jgi:hypothetical protein
LRNNELKFTQKSIEPDLMKFTKILLLLFILAIAVSCGDDDDGGTPLTTNSLEGTYNIVSFTGMATYTDTENGVTTIENSAITASNFVNATITFTAAGTVTSTGTYTLTETTTENGVVTDEFSYEEEVDINATYSINGNEIVINGILDGASSARIENFSNAGLNLVLNFSETDTDFSVVGTATYELVRQ